MATLGELKTQIRRETNKDDIGAGAESEGALNQAIADAIEFWSDELFWFNKAGAIVSATVSTVAGIGFVATPAAIRIADKVVHDGGELRKFALDQIEGATETGTPKAWAANGDTLQLWPIPDAAYTLTVFGTAQIDAPVTDADETVWTNEARSLIAARVRFLLYRDTWRDVEATQLAAQAEGEALTRLRRETRRRNGTPLRSTGDEPWSAPSTFNISQGN